MKIVILDGYTSNPGDLNWDKLKILGDLTVYEYTKNQTEDVVERLQDCEIALTNKTVITKEIMEVCPKLRYIGVLATGYNVVDMKAAAERGITVTNVPGYSTQAVSQQAFALLLDGISVSGIIRWWSWITRRRASLVLVRPARRSGVWRRHLACGSSPAVRMRRRKGKPSESMWRENSFCGSRT